jgi:hypothetical protein
MELDLQSLFGLNVYSCTHWLRFLLPPSPAFGLIYEAAIFWSAKIDKVFVTPWSPIHRISWQKNGVGAKYSKGTIMSMIFLKSPVAKQVSS